MTAQGAIDAILSFMQGMPEPARQWGSERALEYAPVLGMPLGRAFAAIGLWAFALFIAFGVAAVALSAWEKR